MVEISAGGIVYFKSNVLMLRKYNGDWVLPKGRVEDNESFKDAAIREVYEESKARVSVIKYIGKISYEFNRTLIVDRQHIQKEVHWYLMTSKNMQCSAQKNEGFVTASYIPFERALKIARYDDERKMITEAIEDIKYYGYK